MISDYPAELDVVNLSKPTGLEDNPKQRLKDPLKAMQMVNLFIEADRERSFLNSKVQGMLDGNAPYSQAKLNQEGRGADTNVNFREGEAALDSAITPYYDLFAESDTYCQIEVNERDIDVRDEYSRTVTKEFDEMLKEWDGMDWNIQLMLHDMVGFGKGYVMWPDKTNWHFDAVRHTRVLVPNGAKSTIDRQEVIVVRQALLVHELYAKIRNSKAAKDVGWDIKATMEAIAGACPEYKTANGTYDWERAQEELRNHDLYESVRSSVITIANIYVKEFNGKVSHLIVEERNASRLKDPKDYKPKFMFKKVGRYDNFRQALCPFFHNIGDGTWHSIKGLGVKLFPFMSLKNRVTCATVDNLFVNMSVLVQASTANVQEGTALMRVGPMTIMPPNLTIQQWGLSGRMEEGLAVDAALTNKLESNTGQYRQPLMNQKGNPETATGIQYNASKEASLSKGAVNRFYAQLDYFFEELYRRASNPNLEAEDDGRGPNAAALRFQKRCIDAGVPPKCLLKPRFVRATRNSGNGSIFLRQQVFNNTMPIVPMMNETGRQNWLRDAISVMAGSENAERWAPQQSLSPSLQLQQRTAMMENAVLKDGSPVLIVGTDNHFIHATVHLGAGSEALNSIPEGADPVQVLAFIDAVGPHAGQHIQMLAQDTTRAQETKVLEKQWKQLATMADQLRAQVQKQQQEAAKQAQAQQQALQEQFAKSQQVMSDAQIKEYVARNNVELSKAKAQERIRLSAERHSQDLVLKRQKAEQGLVIADAETATSIRNQTVKTSAEVANKTRKTKPE